MVKKATEAIAVMSRLAGYVIRNEMLLDVELTISISGLIRDSTESFSSSSIAEYCYVKL